jgi:hypothetical protein
MCSRFSQPYRIDCRKKVLFIRDVCGDSRAGKSFPIAFNGVHPGVIKFHSTKRTRPEWGTGRKIKHNKIVS